MRTTITALAATALATITLTGCSPTFEVAAPEQDPTTVESPAPADAGYGTYGSDPELDALQDECARGDSDACNDLFWDSPLDSEYEAFANERLDTGDVTGMTEQEAAEYAYNLVIETLPDEIDAELCEGYRYDPDLIVGAYLDGFTGEPLSDGTYVYDWIPMDTIEADAYAIFADVCSV